MKAEYESVGDVLERVLDKLRDRESGWIESELRRHAPIACTLVDTGQRYAASRLLRALGYEIVEFPDGRLELRRNAEILSVLPPPFPKSGGYAPRWNVFGTSLVMHN